MDDKLNELECIAKKLNESCDRLNDLIEKMEERLNKSCIGIECEVLMKVNTNHEKMILSYARHGKSGWGFWVKYREFGNPNRNGYDEMEDRVYALVDGSRIVRVMAMKFLPELLDKVIDAGKSLSTNASEACENAQCILKELP